MFVVEQVTFLHLCSSMFQQGLLAGASRSALAKQGLLEHAGHAARERVMKYSQGKVLIN